MGIDSKVRECSRGHMVSWVPLTVSHFHSGAGNTSSVLTCYSFFFLLINFITKILKFYFISRELNKVILCYCAHQSYQETAMFHKGVSTHIYSLRELLFASIKLFSL